MKNIDEIFLIALKNQFENAQRGSKTKAAEFVGITKQKMNNVLSGIRASTEEERRGLARFFGFSYEDFLQMGQAIKNGRPTPEIEEESTALTADEMKARGFFAVPLSENMRLAAGCNGTIPITYDEKESAVIVHGPTLGRKNAKGLQAFRVGGDSMEPLIAQNGLVMADTRDNDIRYLKPGKIYVICWDLDDGECAVKRLEWVEKGKLLAIESENTIYKTIYRKPQDVRLIGRVVWAWREF